MDLNIVDGQQELTKEQVDQLHGGKKPYGQIYDHAALDPELSEQFGRNRYKVVPYIKIKSPGVKDYMSYPLSEEHKQQFPDAWAHYQKARAMQADGRITAKILPCMNPAIWQELQELGKVFVDELAEELIPGLEIVHEQAKMHQRLAKPRLRYVDGELKEIAA